MKKPWKFLVSNYWLVEVTPHWVKRVVRKLLPTIEYEKLKWEKFDRLSGLLESDYDSPYDVRLGIVKDFAHYHSYYISACREMKVSYKVVDIFSSNWLEEIDSCGCDAFLVWPSVNLEIWKNLFDERLYILSNELNKILFPSYTELWLYENKRRVRDWLLAHNIPHPETWIFYNEEEALQFVKNVDYPIVRKTARGGASSGVKIVKTRREGIKEVKKAFKNGFVIRDGDKRDRQWGYIIFQEYIPHEHEWRIVRVGDSFMCRKKIKRGEYASGSGRVVWASPPDGLLDFVFEMTELGKFRSMAVDVFDSPKGFLVNELQALWGDIKPENIHLGEKFMGRYLKDKRDGSWTFEKGYFYSNACANLRVQYILNKILG